MRATVVALLVAAVLVVGIGVGLALDDNDTADCRPVQVPVSAGTTEVCGPGTDVLLDVFDTPRGEGVSTSQGYRFAGDLWLSDDGSELCWADSITGEARCTDDES